MTTAVDYPSRRFRREEYERMAEIGILREDERLELIEGEIIPMSPQAPAHFTALELAAEACRRCFGGGYCVRRQGPLALGDASEPEPDVAVVAGNTEDYRDHHPETAVLVIETSESSLALDRTEKASMYAKAGIQDYWIQNLVNGILEVRRDPVQLPSAVYGADYASVTLYQKGQHVAPLARPNVPIAVDDLLP